MKVVSREVWLEERMAFLRREKAVTRELDSLARERQKLPWVRIERNSSLETPAGTTSLEGLFGPYSQPIVYPFMFGPD